MKYRTYKTLANARKRADVLHAMHPDKDFRPFVDESFKWYVGLCSKGRVVARCA